MISSIIFHFLLYLLVNANRLNVVYQENIEQINAQRIIQNGAVVPTLSCDCEDSRRLHEFLWPLLWLRHRFARGTERHFQRIPSISFELGEDFFDIRTDPVSITYPNISKKYVKVSIIVQQKTDMINELRGNDENPPIRTPEQAAQDAQDLANQILHEADQVDGKQENVNDGKMILRHYHKYILEAWYTCKNLPMDPKAIKCDDWQYYLDSINVTVTYNNGTMPS